MRKYSLLFIALVSFTLLVAQKPVIAFEKNSHDFGKINEDDGKATIVFNFTNKGNAPMVVSRVQASCGCTTPTWTKEPIEPGKKGTITVAYNPLGRPGAFTKTISVYSNAVEELVNLTIRGEVIPKPTSENTSTSLLPVIMGDLRLSGKAIQMNNIDKGKTQLRSIDIQNTGNSNIRPMVENLPVYITAKVTPEILKSNETGKINFTFNSSLCNQWGPLSDEVYVSLNGQKKFTQDFQLQVYSNIVEDFGKLTPDQKRKAPILETAGRTISFGEVKQGSKKSSQFKISNKGINPLEIRRIINNNREITLHQPKLSIGSGKAGQLSFTLDAKSLPEGEYKKSITIQTNDPDNSFIILVLNWKVKK